MMQKIILVFVMISIISCIFIEETTVGDIPWPFTICGQGNWDPEKVTFISQPKRDSNSTIDITGTSKDSISFKQVDLTVKLNGAYLHSETFPFSKSYDEGDTVQFRYTSFIPSFAPPGNYAFAFNFINKGQKAQGCVAIAFKL